MADAPTFNDDFADLVALLRAADVEFLIVGAHALAAHDFARPGTVYQLGLPPRRIDILTQISGVSFDEAAPTVNAPTGRDDDAGA